MKNIPLFPHRFKLWAWLGLVPTLLFGIYMLFTDYVPDGFNVQLPAFVLNGSTEPSDNNWLNELVGLLLLFFSLIVAFARCRHEDEWISALRLRSLLWAVYINAALLALSMLFIYDLLYFYVMAFNMYTVLLIFIAHFHWHLWRMNKTWKDEE